MIESSNFINPTQAIEKIEPLMLHGATSQTYKYRIDGKLYFMKRLRPELNHDPRYREAFHKEFEAGKSIASPYVVKYTSIEDNGEDTYILMEYVNGVTLEEKLTSEPEYFTKKQNIKKLLTQLASALGALHKHGIVHLDISPKNIMLTKTTNNVVLVDLGYCLTNRNDSTPGCTKSFSAPETLSGQINEIDARSDIFSIGCLLQYIEEKSSKKLPRTYTNIKARCLQKQKQDRFSTAKDIIDTIHLNYIKKLVQAAAVIILLILICGAQPCKRLYTNICDYIAWERGLIPHRFESEGVFYHITNQKERTVEVTFKGNHPDEYKDEYKGGEVFIPQTVTYRGRTFKVTAFAGQAFKNPYISKIHIPQGIETIADSAFIYCNQSGTIYIPKSVKKIGVSAFFPMLYVDKLQVDTQNTFYDSRNECNAIIETATNTLLAGCNNTTIPEGVERIAVNAFVGAYKLRHIILPASLKEIDEAVFVHSGITEIEIPEGVATLKKYTFQYCEKLQKVTLPQSLTSIGLGALSHCAFSEIIIPDSVTHIDEYAFDCNNRLTTATIGSGVRNIGYGAFENCVGLNKVVSHIPADSLFEIDNSVFGNIAPNCTLHVPRGAKKRYASTIGWNLFTKIVEME